MKSLGLLLLAISMTLAIAMQSPEPASADFDCGDFSTQAEAQDYLEPGDPYGLDADSDGIACESNPCPCGSGSAGGDGGSGGGHAEPAAPPPYHLKKSAARRAAQRIVRRFVAQSPAVDSALFGPCLRQAERSVDCLATATGETTMHSTSCQLRVAVRAVDRRPRAQLEKTECQTKSTAQLTAAQAKQAMLRRAREFTENSLEITELERRTHRTFVGWTEWTEYAIHAPRAFCFAEIEVELVPPEELRVSVLDSACKSVLQAAGGNG